ncbi:MAG: hypothetical protein U9N44_00360 [Chloroflexota bacterium]|nr:hypothetical protein [Chloroflexota bacterium]
MRIAGSIITAICGILLIVSLAAKGGRGAVITLGIFAIVGALAAIGGCIWFTIDAATNDVFSFVSYGYYIAIGAAILGLIFAILTAAFAKGRQDW